MRGFWFTLESVIAGIMVVTFMGFLVTRSFTPPPEDLTPLAYQTLKNIDDQGLLRPYAQDNNYSAIDSQVHLVSYSHSVEVCSMGTCVGSPPSGDDVWVGTFLTAGNSLYAPREVKLYLYR